MYQLRAGAASAFTVSRGLVGSLGNIFSDSQNAKDKKHDQYKLETSR